MKRRIFQAKIEKRIYLLLWVVILLLNGLAIVSTRFADWHRKYVFPLAVNVYARLTNLAFFSIGEWMIIVGVLLVVAALIATPVYLIGRVHRRYLHAFLWILVAVSLIMTENCYILYHATSFHDLYITDGESKDYSLEDLAAVREYVVTQANALAPLMERDENGELIYDGDPVEQARYEMARMGETYPLLAGYYPRAKAFYFAETFSRQSMMGYYFPFSMEANYNPIMYSSNIPATICHELSHLKGVIYEDDANLIGYLACVSSEDPFFRYSGYLSVLSYLNQALFLSLGSDREAYAQYTQMSDLVRSDRIYLTEEVQARIEENALVDAETQTELSQTFLDTNQKVQGISQGITVYSEVVQRLLEYYDGVLY